MSRRKELLAQVQTEQIIGVVRDNSVESALAVAHAYAQNGIRFVEITLTSPDALELIATMSQQYAGEIVVAAGTCRSTNDAAMARRAGAEVIVSPHTDPQVIEYANENDP